MRVCILGLHQPLSAVNCTITSKARYTSGETKEYNHSEIARTFWLAILKKSPTRVQGTVWRKPVLGDNHSLWNDHTISLQLNSIAMHWFPAGPRVCGSRYVVFCMS